MSAPHEYHRPNGPDSPDDSDEDLELLDPIGDHPHTSSPPHNSSPNERRPLHELGARIPLRNLRVGRLRGNSHMRHNDPDAESLRGLVDDDDDSTKRHSQQGSIGTIGDDDAPLLPGGSPRRREKPQGRMARLKSHVRLPSFMSSRPLTPPEPPANEVEADDHDPASNRTVAVGQIQTTKFPPNAVSNAKYTPWSFLPRTLYNEFSFFFNMYFLLVALSQVIPALRIGYLSTYIAPLAFVISITLGKEAIDDIHRRRRDAEANSEPYTVLRFDDPSMGSGASAGAGSKRNKLRRKSKMNRPSRMSDAAAEEERLDGTGRPTASVSEIVKPSKDLKVGDILKLGKDQRVPADLVILAAYVSDNAIQEPQAPELPVSAEANLIDTDGDDAGHAQNASEAQKDNAASGNDSTGEAFIRTDQLDGETDWKLRLASSLTQSLDVSEFTRLRIVAGKPDKKVNDFVGTVELLPKQKGGYDPHDDESVAENAKSAPLTIDNTAWANTVLASSSTVLGVVVYTGPETRQALSTSPSRSKVGLLELEINSLTKILCFLTLALSFILVALKGFDAETGRPWYVSVMRFLILFSTIVPISLRVNLDMGKSVYARFIEKDQGIPGTIVRTSTIPEDLGRVEYLLSDKTGTLTQNGKHSPNYAEIAAMLTSL
ncbi:phospholipid-translocating p-type ATPase [Neofusicoccum parvum]|nr:phospholipid-translocating p-type ATPase [Neofusicoccum parvum]